MSAVKEPQGRSVGNEGRLRIDPHVHLLAFDRKCHGCFYRGADRNSPLFAFGKIFFGVRSVRRFFELDERIADLTARMVREARFLDRAVLLAIDGTYDESGRFDPKTESMISNEWTLEVTRRYPDVFLFGASVHPNRKDALDELERLAEAGAVLIKWIPPAQNIDPSNRRYVPFYEKMLELGLVLLSHTGYEHTLPVADQSLGDPERLRLPLEVGLTVIAGHAGTSGFYHPVEYFPNFVRMLERYDNLYGDTAAVTAQERFTYKKWLLSSDFVLGRLIHGTDFPSPSIPLLWARALGLRRAFELQLMRNIFDQDYLAKREAGFPEEHFLKAHDIFGKFLDRQR